MRFYRVEHKETRHGVYESFAYFSTISTSPSDRHPMPHQDSLLVSNLEGKLISFNDQRFGFNSILQLKNWFYNDAMLAELNTAGFVLSVYETNKIFEGSTQCIMLGEDHDKAHRVEEINLLTLTNTISLSNDTKGEQKG